MAVAYYEKVEVKSFGTSEGGWTKTTVDGKRVYTRSVDGGSAVVNFKDGTNQTHPPAGRTLKTGSKLTWDPVNKTLEVEEDLL